MGSAIKKMARLGSDLSPHTWILGKKFSHSIDLGGQLLGAYDDQYKAQDPMAPPSPLNTDAPAYAARDRVRRMARKAQGVDSTIKTGALGAPYTGSPAKLLGG